MTYTEKISFIHKYLCNELNADEIKEFESWIEYNYDNKLLFDQVSGIWNNSVLPEEIKFDAESAFLKHKDKLSNEIKDSVSPSQNSKSGYVIFMSPIRLAAAIFVLLLALTADGYPVPQSHISRMNDAVRYLLPAIPTLFYGGLGRHQVDRLAVLRKACERTWERRALGRPLTVDFASLFQDVLSQFDTQPEGFSPQRVQDELVGQMAELLEADYDTLALEVDDSESRQRVLTSEPAAPNPATPVAPAAPAITPQLSPAAPTPRDTSPVAPPAETPSAPPAAAPNARDGQRDERLQGYIVTPAPTTERLSPSRGWSRISSATSYPTSRQDAANSIVADDIMKATRH